MAQDGTLPRSIDGITTDWLTSALRARSPGVTVVSATVDKVIWGTATKVLMDLRYAGGPEAQGLPNKLCIKGEFDERVRQTLASMTMTGTQVEAEFYNNLAPQVGVPIPRHWFAASEPGMGILVLDNLAALGSTFGTPTEAWTPDTVGKALDILATLHGSTWDRKFAGIPWLQVGSPAVRQASEFLLSEQHWKDHFASAEVFQLPPALADLKRCLNGLRSMWRHDDASAHCLVHGDAHLGNTCIDAAGQPYFIDWAGPCISNWAFDVSYFVSGALSVADRRTAEQDLLRRYLEQLARSGGPALDWDEAWDDYRRHHMQGILWTCLPAAMQSPENVHAMGERYAAALIDHDTLRLLGA